MTPTTQIKHLGTIYTFTDKKAVLTEDQLKALLAFCLHHDGKIMLPDLGKKQMLQLATFVMVKAEEYNTTHSMRYTIMRDFVKAAFGVKRSRVYVSLEGDIYHVYRHKQDNTPLQTFTEYSDLDQYCQDNDYEFNKIEGLE